jgi:oligosaccharide repeat unit polymerase
MIFATNLFRGFNCLAEFTGTYPSSWGAAPTSQQPVRIIALRSNEDLPFYCRPVSLFVLVWFLMICAVSVRISYDSYPDMGLPLFLFALSFVALLAGYGGVGVLSAPLPEVDDRPDQYVLNVQRLRRLNWLFVLVATGIMVLNLKLDGLPPAFGFLSFDTVSYLEYGRLKQLLFPLLISIVVNSSLDPSRFRKVAFASFGLLALLLYVTRGEILAALLQVFFVFSLTSRINKRKLLVSGAVVVLGLAFIASMVGNNRTTQSSFFQVLQIRREFWEWPMILLWAISYFSIPISNFCWIVHNFQFHAATLSFLYPALPAFWAPADPHESITGYTHVIDGVHTYLATYFLDLSYVGIVLINLALGIACAFVMRRGLSRQFLTSAVFLACLSYIFFVDNFMPLSTLLQFIIQAFAQRYILSSQPEMQYGPVG